VVPGFMARGTPKSPHGPSPLRSPKFVVATPPGSPTGSQPLLKQSPRSPGSPTGSQPFVKQSPRIPGSPTSSQPLLKQSPRSPGSPAGSQGSPLSSSNPQTSPGRFVGTPAKDKTSPTHQDHHSPGSSPTSILKPIDIPPPTDPNATGAPKPDGDTTPTSPPKLPSFPQHLIYDDLMRNSNNNAHPSNNSNPNTEDETTDNDTDTPKEEDNHSTSDKENANSSLEPQENREKETENEEEIQQLQQTENQQQTENEQQTQTENQPKISRPKSDCDLLKMMHKEQDPMISKSLDSISIPPPRDDYHEKRDKIVKEIVETEETYVKSLNDLMKIYHEPLLNSPYLKQEEVDFIFSGLPTIIAVNEELLKSLHEKMKVWKNDDTIGNVMLKLIPFLGLYRQYLRNYDHARQIISDKKRKQPRFGDFLEEVKQTNGSTALSLISFLIMPIQRIPRYKLLLRELVKYTPESHPDAEDLQSAYDKVSELADSMNESIDLQKKYDELKIFQKKLFGKNSVAKPPYIVNPHRVFIHHGELTKLCRKEPKSRYFLLFNDALLYGEVVTNKEVKLEKKTTRKLTKKSSSTRVFKRSHTSKQPPRPSVPGLNERLEFINKMPDIRVARIFNLHITKFTGIPDNEKYQNAFEIRSKEKSFVLWAASPALKSLWSEKIQEAEKTRQLFIQSKEEHDKFAPRWQHDTESPVCPLCDTKFTHTRRRHHCRKCGTLTCGKCSDYKVKIPNYKEEKKHRVCFICYEDLSGVAPKRKMTLNKQAGQKLIQQQSSVSILLSETSEKFSN